MKPQFHDIRDRLRYVGMEQDDYDLAKFPDFLIIGPQRTGTTWFHEKLSQHPQVVIPWDKELHYFNNLEYPEYHPKSLPPVDKDLGWYLDKFESTLTPQYLKDRRSQAKYDFHSVFSPDKFGEATATYAAALHEGIIEDILTLNPDIKIITNVRNPIDRAWSHAKKDLCKERKRAVKDVPRDEWMEFFNNPYQVKCGHYSQFLPMWEKMIPKGNLMIGRLLDIAERPRETLKKVYNLIGITDEDKVFPPGIEERVNPTESAGIPDELHTELKKIYGDEVKRLKDAGMI